MSGLTDLFSLDGCGAEDILLDTAPAGVRLAPCPPFVRGREVSSEAIVHWSFVGYEFKRSVMPVQQAVMARALA